MKGSLSPLSLFVQQAERVSMAKKTKKKHISVTSQSVRANLAPLRKKRAPVIFKKTTLGDSFRLANAPIRKIRLNRGMKIRDNMPLSIQPKGNINQNIFRFQKPERVTICVRRRQRKAVLFATKRNGINGMRKRNTNSYSRISCT
ncbi:hypothetical protein [Microviridae sp.]|nr:hypothetical protein [Microviridae sp.]